ncbi:hypothetical protein AMEX_G15275 [Astyanax mexicanus]|uniref:DUF6729 domain-containing protein n=1 Tax=Astyanax mexicanus TaxID=7994 RepID=A0A8T2LLQ0_ASTMX|nr:hypothetical protein AMEX_G15275 [Astyanax mexicanus]
MAKSHKPMADSEWLHRLQTFASTGAWPSNAGNRPAPRQKKWHDLYHKIEKCPLQLRGQATLLAGVQTCTCGFHKGPATHPQVPSPSVSTVPSTSVGSNPLKRHELTLSMFEKSRFGGSHGNAAKPNLNLKRKLPQTQVVTGSPAASKPCTGLHLPPSPRPHHVVQSTSPFSFGPPPPPSSVEDIVPHQLPEAAVKSMPENPAELPLLWPQTVPQQDRKWVSEALFRVGAKGKLELRDNLQLWYHPPPPALLYHQVPGPDRFFSQSLLLWMPYRLWKVRLQCINPACNGRQLSGGGLHRRVRQVLDIDRYYNLATETLICTGCRSSYLSWSQTILQQLDLAHRSEFRVILTRRYACDIRVIRLLRERSLGNGPVRIIGQLKENHSEEWLQRVARYTSECAAFVTSSGLLPPCFQEPPKLSTVPSYKWLLTVYSQDILNRLEDIKASITSTYGTILKMDSTKKITKKLTGPAKGTAQWLTSVGNESGQVLISVLTANEGAGLDLMAAGLVNRYQRAGVDPPVVLYVDCGCCKEVGETKLKSRFGGWPDIIVRLDIWHFMRRLAAGCTTDAHQLYPTFMSRISSCIFEWDAGDVGLLRKAKREQLAQQGWPPLTEKELDRHLTKEELALHCRRKTRGEETTIRLLSQLIGELMSKGNDALGVPLLDSVRMQHIWDVQRRHVACIQDPPNVALYTETGSITKGGVVLKTYRCARGSTSLESFHCHLNRFIPGNSANSLNFQVYLLEGLNRWNQDRAAAAVVKEPSPLRTYTGELVHFVNDSFLKVFGKKLVTAFTPPGQYTGELIGVQYLLRQNNEPLQDMCSTSETMSELLEDLDVQDLEDEGFAESANDDGIILADLMISDVASLSEPPEALFQCLPVPSLQPALQPVPSLQPAHQPVPSFQPAPPSLQPTPQSVPSLQPALQPVPSFQPVPSLQPAPQPVPSLQPAHQPVPSFQPAPPSLQPTPQPVPSRHPAPQPVPSLQPALQPVPSFQPVPSRHPAPQPVPSLQPALQPVPSFQPVPSRHPAPQPVPSLQPALQPVPSFQPVPSLQPAPQPVPSLQPAHQPVPSLQPAPQPVPSRHPAPQPVPSLQPTPQPVPSLQPAPQPVPSLQPAPQPVPSLQPAPQPVPSLQPALQPVPSFQPVPSLQPAPQPVPSFQPAPPSLQPTPQPVPSRHPAPQPVPSLQPALQPVPSFQPVPSRHPAPQPVPSLQPALQPVPSRHPAPQPVPSLQPTPQPVPSLQPAPQPVPSLQPAPQPVPSLQPAPQPVPSLQPALQPVPSFQPVPSLQPAPQPVPSFQPAPPSLQPTPQPVPSLQPAHQPVPSFQPALQPVPSFQPAPPSLQPTPQPVFTPACAFTPAYTPACAFIPACTAFTPACTSTSSQLVTSSWASNGKY